MLLKIFHSLLVVLILTYSLVGYASLLPEREQIEDWLSVLSSDDSPSDIEQNDIEYAVLPGPFYTPELGVGLGIAAVATYRLDDNDRVSQDSSLTLTGYVSSSGAFGVGFDNYNFFAEDKWRFFLSGEIEDTPTYYWGIGYDAGNNNSNKEKYTLNSFALTPRLLYNIQPETYVGLAWDLSLYKANELTRGDNSKFMQLPEGKTIKSSGLGLNFIYDSRDFIPNPSKGQILDASAFYYSSDMGSDERFQRYRIKYGHYSMLDDMDNYLIAYELNLDLSSGDVPWNKMPLLGGSKHMRGYYEGRYRDHNMISTQIELRQKLDWRHGMVYWVGAGSVSHQPHEIGTKKWLPNVGVGYRFEFQPRMNVRLDLGFGRDSVGFYFQVGEAF